VSNNRHHKGGRLPTETTKEGFEGGTGRKCNDRRSNSKNHEKMGELMKKRKKVITSIIGC